MHPDFLLPKLAQAHAEIDRLGYLSNRTRYRLYVSDTHYLHNAFFAFSELLCAHYCFSQKPNFLDPLLISKIEANFSYCFEWMRHPKMDTHQFNESSEIVSEFYFDMMDGEEDLSYLDPERRDINQKQQEQEQIRLAACYHACSSFVAYMTSDHISLNYEDSLELEDNYSDYSTADATDWFLAWLTGSYHVEAGDSNGKAWRFYLDQIVPEASKLENRLGNKARTMKLNRLFYT